MRSPSNEITAGSTVTEPMTAQRTTQIVARAMLDNATSRATNRPASAVATVRPETSTVRPEVCVAMRSARFGSTPAWRSWRSRTT